MKALGGIGACLALAALGIVTVLPSTVQRTVQVQCITGGETGRLTLLPLGLIRDQLGRPILRVFR